MNFNGSRLGFWFRLNRRNKSKRVLVFYDEYTNGPSGETDYYTSSGDVNPSTQIWPTIEAQEISLGNQPELIVGYSNLPSDMSVYAHAWDIGYASPYTTNPFYDPTNKLLTYLNKGGALFLLGENNYFAVRDNTIDTFISAAGGGTVSTENTLYGVVTTTIEPEFLLANNNNTVVFNAPGSFLDIGTGTPMTAPLFDTGSIAVCWKTGSLSNARRGAITSVLDINFLVPGGNLQQDFIDNLILTLNQY